MTSANPQSANFQEFSMNKEKPVQECCLNSWVTQQCGKICDDEMIAQLTTGLNHHESMTLVLFLPDNYQETLQVYHLKKKVQSDKQETKYSFYKNTYKVDGEYIATLYETRIGEIIPYLKEMFEDPIERKKRHSTSDLMMENLFSCAQEQTSDIILNYTKYLNKK